MNRIEIGILTVLIMGIAACSKGSKEFAGDIPSKPPFQTLKISYEKRTESQHAFG